MGPASTPNPVHITSSSLGHVKINNLKKLEKKLVAHRYAILEEVSTSFKYLNCILMSERATPTV